jgi:hypothetical protein
LRQLRDISAGRRGNAHPTMVEVTRHRLDAELRAMADYASRLDARERSPGVRGSLR